MIRDSEEHTDETGEEEMESEHVVLVTSGKINLTKGELNMLAFKDVFRVGKEEMKKKNYKVLWVRKQRRKIFVNQYTKR